MISSNRLLSNGLTREEYLKSLYEKFSQPLIKYPKQANTREWLDVPYSDLSSRQKINIYTPESKGPHPLLVWIHGGAWFMGDRSDFALSHTLPFLKYGYAIASIGYRLADETIFPGQVEDAVAAINFLKKHAVEYQLDGDRFAVMSGSAGTNIAALAALKANVGSVIPEYDIKAVILRCPILDFTSIRRQFEEIGLSRERFDYPDEDTSIEALYLGGSTLELREKCKASDPANHLYPDMPAFLLMHGLVDIDTPYLQSVGFAESISKAAGEEKVKLVLFPDTGHDNGLYDADSTMELMLEFLKTHL